MDKKIKHLEMIQNIISRMANNSFLLKGWSVVLISALFALAAKNSNPYYIYLTYFPAIAFWILDGYYLSQERLFRKLYDKVRLIEESNIDFSMDTSSVKDRSGLWLDAIFSKTLNIFHGTIVVTIILIMGIVVYIMSKRGG